MPTLFANTSSTCQQCAHLNETFKTNITTNKTFSSIPLCTSRNNTFTIQKQHQQLSFVCSQRIKDMPDYSRDKSLSVFIDTVNVFANAIKRLIQSSCSSLAMSHDADAKKGINVEKDGCSNGCEVFKTNRSRRLLQCLSGPKLLKLLLETNIMANNGEIKFDENGDLKGKYEVLNYQKKINSEGRQVYVSTRVAVWDIANENFEINASSIMWNVKDVEEEKEEDEDFVDFSEKNSLTKKDSKTYKKEHPLGIFPWFIPTTWGTLKQERVGRKKKGKKKSRVPVSVCGRNCDKGEVYSFFKDACCWQCRRCGPNEVTVQNNTRFVVFSIFIFYFFH